MVLRTPFTKLKPERVMKPVDESKFWCFMGREEKLKNDREEKPLKYLRLVKIQKKVNTCILKN